MRETHDRVVDRQGVFDTCIRMVKMLKEKGYWVQTNSTIFRETTADEIEEMVKLLTSLKVDGMLLSPGYHYQVLANDIYLKSDETAGQVSAGQETRRRLQDYQYPDLPGISDRRA